jgi:hypothetical protein
MPRIVDYGQRTSVGGVGPGLGRVRSGDGLISLGNALESATRDVIDVRNQQREEDAAVWSAKALSNAQTEWSRQLVERQKSAGDGAPDFTPSLLKDFDEYAGKLSGSAPTQASKTYMRERLAAYRASLSDSALAFEAGELASYTENVVALATDAGRTEAFQRPDRFSELLAERLTLIDNMRLPPERKRQLAEDAQYRIAYGAIAGLAEQDPVRALELMRAPVGKSGVLAVEALSADDRLQLMEATERMRLADDARAHTLAESAERDLQDQTSKQGDALVANGELTAAWIEANRERLSAEDFRYFYGALRNPPGAESGPANVEVYADLRERAGLGQDIRDEARAALQKAQIRVQDYNTLTSEVESGRPNWYTRGVQFISTAAAVSDLNPEVGAANRKANMLDDWQEWAARNPKASDADAQKAYRQIVREYALVDVEQMLITQRAPTYLVGDRRAPDLAATEAATVQALQRGDIDEVEAARQAALIDEWRRILGRAAPDGGN